MTNAGLRNFWFQVHKWIGLILLVLIVPISVSGAALVWHDALDAALSPARYAVSAGEQLPLAVLADKAKAVAHSGERLAALRHDHGGPVVATLVTPVTGGPLRRTSVWMDPATGRVADRADANSGLVRVLHGLHGSLLIPGMGRQVVGWVGVALLISSLTGIWLWWPLTGRTVRGLRWKRRNSTNANLHYLSGFWIALPLAMLSFTGVWISFPAVFGPLVGAKAPDPAERQRRMGAVPLSEPRTTVASAVDAARTVAKGEVVSLNWPTDRAPEWQVGIQTGAGPAAAVKVRDATGQATAPKPVGAQPVARTMRVLHDGTGMGPVWQLVIFLGGLIPAVLAYTGVAMWLRERRKRATRPA